ncbi:MAG: ATP-binding cassette domain-containing protein [Desulfobulbus sp.]|jgi:ABC-2 type transport system ATP-binding protein|uniref:ATP-binding cassette domain-containing protein n=1 Tax=Desulfobulbus sp. TaxID=895 RepID=UPI0028514B78|nr:ATP-binding cassette domain-containing protein [Desulfobulbus sp.]MDR2550962.1 ATP-binding cassette domain-containing protein [Desulfobulbus sp.]
MMPQTRSIKRRAGTPLSAAQPYHPLAMVHQPTPANSPPASAGLPPEAVLALDRVDKGFVVEKKRVAALSEVSCAIRPGRVTGLIGPDAAGKTTLMRLCAGLLLPDRGTVRVLGEDVVRNPLAVQAQIGYMPQRFGLYEDLSVRENLDLYADLQGVPAQERSGRYRQLLAMAGLEGFQGRLAGRLSGGMKQKLGLVCTLVRPPRLLLLDEPTVGVDPVSRRELWQIVYHLVEAESMSVLLSTAYLDEAERCAEVVLIHCGRILGHDEPRSFSRQMAGRIWLVRAPALAKRTLQRELSRDPAILDALVLGTSVRAVGRDGTPPVLANLSDPSGAEILPVAPRFEDYFVATLKDEAADGESNRIALGGLDRRTNGNDVIAVDNLVRRFGSFFAVDRVSFRVRPGEIFGLLGANGAGKTTTFRMLCGLLPITSGTCTVAGLNLRTAAAAARGRIGYMAQKFSLYGNLTVRQNLRFFSSAYGLHGARRRRQIDWALATFDLEPYAASESQDLPLGFKQRLALAVALMHEPEVLFLDEPTSGVDPLARRDFWAQINSLADQGVTVLVTTHFMEEAEYCDRLVIMADGRVLAEGTPEEMKERHGGGAGSEATMEDAFIGLLQHRQPTGATP